MQEMKERKIAMDLYMDDIHQSDRRGKRRDKRREGRQREFLISICHSFFMRFLSLDILDFPLAFFLTVVWVQAFSEFITFVNK